MKTAIRLVAAATVLMAAQVAVAQGRAPGSTGQCKDGTYTSAASKQGACRGHQGVKDWYVATTPADSKTSAVPPAPKPAAAAPTPAAAPAPAAPAAAPAAPKTTASSKPSPSSKAASMTQAAGGGPGLVWVNTDSNVYHCYGSTYYGKTKQGTYMSEADAKAKGAHADHGHACGK